MDLYISVAEESVLVTGLTPDESDAMNVCKTNRIFSENEPIHKEGYWIFDGEPKRACLKAPEESADSEKGFPITLKMSHLVVVT